MSRQQTINNGWCKAALLIAGCLLLATGCQRKTESQSVESTPDTPPWVATDAVAPANTVADTAAKKPESHALEQDTAEITNLRILARKQPTIYDPKLIVGEWLRNSEHEVYYADGTGKCWDSSDDIQDSEAMTFQWTMDSNLLTIKHTMQLGAVMMRLYLVTFVDEESLVYKTIFDESFMWDKVPALPTE